MMKACFLAMFWLLASSSSAESRLYTEAQILAYVKSVDVKTLDPALHSRSLEAWLQSEPVHAETVIWTVEETCWMKPFANEEYPLCVEVQARRKGQWGRFLVQVGTNFKGIFGPPQLKLDVGIQVSEGDSYTSLAYAERLSDLPGILEQPNRPIIDGVKKLYEEVVAHHPIGIPTGAEMATMLPLLSKPLAEQLKTAQSCEEDYLRHQTTDSSRNPTWLKTDIFSGHGEQALPTYSFAYSRGRQKDGSFLVYVELRHSPDPVHSLAVRNIERTWEAAVRVVVEDDRFVVDDIRIFDNDGYRSSDGPSHLLSDSFVGCDGPRWVGIGTATK
jgi:hypothetical protein